MSYLLVNQATPEEQTILQSPKSKKIKKQDISQRNTGHWTKEEHELYLAFLDQNAQNRKNVKIFKPMAEVIGTRTPSQCRSHHQKFNPSSPQVQRKLVIHPPRKMSADQQLDVEDMSEFHIQLKKYDDDNQQIEVDPIAKLFSYNFNLDEYV